MEYSLFYFLQPPKNVETILGLWAIQKQTVGTFHVVPKVVTSIT